MGNRNTQAANGISTNSVGFTQERIYGVLRQVLVGTSIKPRWSTNADIIYRWFRGPKIESILGATKKEDDEEVVNSKDWMLLLEEKNYVAAEEDSMHAMKVEAWLSSEIDNAPRYTQIFYVLPKLPNPPARQMLPVQNDITAPINTDDFTFSLMSYNILAECYCDNMRYFYCPAYAVLWEYRISLICREIEGFRPDIFCLQEFEDRQYLTFTTHFGKYDYQGEYVKRTSLKSDGCGIFFNVKKFKLVKKFQVELDQIVSNSPELQSFPDLTYSTRRNNVAIILMLQTVNEMGHPQPKYVWVSNCHLYWDPAVPEIKLMQAWYLLRQLHEYQQEMKTEMNLREDQYTTLACGDFNSLPDSMVYELHATQRIKETIAPQMVKYSSIVEFTSPIKGFESSYKSNGDPVSNFTPDFKGCLDYIWYQPASCTLLEVLENPTNSKNAELVQSLNTYTALPSPLYPSDHLPLMARYALNNISL